MASFFQTAMGDIEIMQVNEIVDMLSIFKNIEIQNGLQQYQISGPRTQAGYLRKPAPGDLYNFLMCIRGKAQMQNKPPDEEPPPITRVTQNQREAIAKELDFDLRNIGKVKGCES